MAFSDKQFQWLWEPILELQWLTLLSPWVRWGTEETLSKFVNAYKKLNLQELLKLQIAYERINVSEAGKFWIKNKPWSAYPKIWTSTWNVLGLGTSWISALEFTQLLRTSIIFKIDTLRTPNSTLDSFKISIQAMNSKDIDFLGEHLQQPLSTTCSTGWQYLFCSLWKCWQNIYM